MWILMLLGLVVALLIKDQNYRWLYIIGKTYKRDVKLALVYTKLGIYMWLWETKQKTVAQIFSSVAKANRFKVAMFFEDQVWTFAELDEFSNQIARYFRNQDFKKDDSVALLMENRPEYVGLWLGLAKIGVTTALINTNLVSQPLVHCITVAKSKGIIFGSNHAQVVSNVKEGLKSHKLYQFHEVEKEGASVIEDATDLRQELKNVSRDKVEIDFAPNVKDPLLYIYTSGTTGLPKAALISNIRYLYTALGLGLAANIRRQDNLYIPLPLYHAAGGMLGAGQMLITGATLTVRKKFSASSYWKDCAKYRCSHAQYIGEMCRYILATNQEPIKHSVRTIVGNGLRPQLWKEFVDKFSIKNVCEFYGATEGISNIVNVDSRLGSIGAVPRYCKWVYPITLIKCNETTGDPIRDENGRCVECEINEPGLIVGKISQKKAIFKFEGYSDEKDTEKKVLKNVFSEGDFFFNSGDVLVYDEFGYFYFKDRTGDTFRWKGENVSTAEVEGVISNIVQLNDAVVFGVEVAENEGKAGMAAIVDLDKSLDVGALATGLKANLPAYAVPVFLRIMETIQMTGTYKLKKVDLQKEGYDVEQVTDKLFFFDAKQKTYVPLSPELHAQIRAGKIKV